MSRVGLAISAFRSDEAVEQLLRQAVPLVGSSFDRILVVDSLGSGALATLIEREGWSSVEYVSAATNLGSAGNLSDRLRRSAANGLDYVYAVNHDGLVDPAVISRLVEFARARPRVAAAYPLRKYSRRGGVFDLTGTSRFPRPLLGSTTRPTHQSVPVYWGSSNGALYACEPIRRGLLPWGDFWMGWEDLAYGWLLDDHGYQQFIVTAAEVVDDYEYGSAQLGPVEVPISQKPDWYSYYVARNLLLTMRRTGRPLPVKGALLLRVAAECLAAGTVRAHRGRKLSLMLRGVLDGARGRVGKGPVP